MPPPPTPPADALVLTLRRGGTLTAWAHKGALERERLWLAALAEVYPRIVLVTHGDTRDLDAAAAFDGIDPLVVVPARASGRAVAGRVRDLLPPGIAGVVVQSVHADDGGLGATVTRRLRELGVATTSIVRCSYLPSRRAASNGKPHGPEAIAAGALEYDTFRHADYVIGVSRSIIGDLTWRYGFNPDRTCVIPNFVPVDTPDEVVSPMDRPTGDLVAVGPVDWSQRHDLLVDAIASLSPDLRRETTLTVIGEGPNAASLKRRAADRDVNFQTVHGMTYPELIDRLRRCTAVVHAAPVGPQPRPILEAMSVGTPVIANLSGAPLELLCNGVTGLAVPGEVEAFASAFVGLLPDLDWREMLGAAAAQKVRSICGIERIRFLTIEAHRQAIERETAAVAA